MTAMELLDTAMSDMRHRNLIPSGEVLDALLDIRLALLKEASC